MKNLLMLLVLFSASHVFAGEAKSILDRIDRLYRAESSHSKMTMVISTPDWERTMKMESWSKGQDFSFVRILSPRKDKGIATLKRHQEMWNFFPKINKVMKIPPSMMLGSWMGSDFTNDDLVKENSLADDYNDKLVRGKEDIVTLIPKNENKALWGKIEIYLQKPDHKFPTKQIFYDEKGEKIRTMEYKNVKKVGSKELPMTMVLIPHDKKGHKTTVTYDEIEFDVKLKSDTFTKKNLQKRR